MVRSKAFPLSMGLLLLALFCLSAAALAQPGDQTALAQANVAYKAKDFQNALGLYTTYYHSLPSCEQDMECSTALANALLHIGQCAQGLKRYAEARSWFDQLLTTYGRDSAFIDTNEGIVDTLAKAQYQIAVCYKEEGAFAAAKSALDNVQTDYPKEKGWRCLALVLKGECQLLGEEYGPAADTFKKALADYQHRTGPCQRAKIALTQALMMAGKPNGLTAVWAGLDKVAKDYSSDAFITGYVSFLNGRYPKRDDFPDFEETSRAYLWHARFMPDAKALATISQLELCQKAREAGQNSSFADARDLSKLFYNKYVLSNEDPKRRHAKADWLISIGQLCLQLNDYAEARVWLQQVLDKYTEDSPSPAAVQQMIADSYAQEGKYSEAIGAYDKVIANYSTEGEQCADALMAKGQLQHENRKPAEAVQTFKKVVSDYPKAKVLPEAKIRVGEETLLTFDLDTAYESLNPLLQDISLSRGQLARVMLSISTSRMRDNAEAEAWCDQVIVNFADTKCARQAYFKRALYRSARGAYNDALSDIDMIKEPATWRLYALGRLHYYREEYAEAIESFSQAIAAWSEPVKIPTDVPMAAIMGLEDCYKKLGDDVNAAKANTQLVDFRARYLGEKQ
jgi:tetratricopeptide (TPR) repeat protein